MTDGGEHARRRRRRWTLPTPSAAVGGAPAAPRGDRSPFDILGWRRARGAEPAERHAGGAPPPGAMGGGMDDLLGLLGGSSPTPAQRRRRRT